MPVEVKFKGFKKLPDILPELEGELNDELRKTAINLIVRLAIVTPKKTGEATGEWQATINKQASSKTGREDLTGATVATEEARKIDLAENFILPTIYISNLADHIGELNDGTSDQAPAKFIETALLEAVSAR